MTDDAPPSPPGPSVPAPSAARVVYERSFVGAAIVDPVAGTLLVSKARLDDFHDPLAFRVFLALVWNVRALDAPEVGDGAKALATTPPVRTASMDLERVIEDLTTTRELAKFGGREAVESLVADRPALREALDALRAAAARIGSTSA